MGSRGVRKCTEEGLAFKWELGEYSKRSTSKNGLWRVIKQMNSNDKGSFCAF